jgi:hypothetical protein
MSRWSTTRVGDAGILVMLPAARGRQRAHRDDNSLPPCLQALRNYMVSVARHFESVVTR